MIFCVTLEDIQAANTALAQNDWQGFTSCPLAQCFRRHGWTMAEVYKSMDRGYFVELNDGSEPRELPAAAQQLADAFDSALTGRVVPITFELELEVSA